MKSSRESETEAPSLGTSRKGRRPDSAQKLNQARWPALYVVLVDGARRANFRPLTMRSAASSRDPDPAIH